MQALAVAALADLEAALEAFRVEVAKLRRHNDALQAMLLRASRLPLGGGPWR